MQRMLDAAAGFQRLGAFVGNDQARQDPCGVARLQMRFQAVGEGVDVDHRDLDTDLRQAIEHMVDQRPAADLDQRLGPVVGQGAHTGAQTGGQHHGDFWRAHGRASAGTCRSNQAFMPARVGSARQLSR